MIELKLTFATPIEAAEAMMKLAGASIALPPASNPAAADNSEPETADDKPKRGRKPKAKDDGFRDEADATEVRGHAESLRADAEENLEAETDEGEASNEAAETQVGGSASTGGPGEVEPVSWEPAEAARKVREALANYMKAHGQDAARQKLMDFRKGVAKLSDITTEEAPAFVAYCEAA